MGICISKKELNEKNNNLKQVSVVKSILTTRKNSVYILNKEPIYKVYKFQEVLGTGYYGTVKVGVPVTDVNKKYAIKSIDKERLTEDKINKITREIEILTEIDHPNIVKYYETYVDNKYIHIVMEYCTGGELLDRIIKKKSFNENDAAEIIYKISSAIAHCHFQNIVHRDLKPENILYENNTHLSDMKIIDFGLSRKKEGTLNTVVGSPYYVAPEVLEGNYDKKCDCWSIGVIMYVLLSGTPPFVAAEKTELYEKIKNEEPEFSSNKWDKISIEAKKLIKSLLEKKPDKRPSCEEIINSPWINAYFTKSKFNMENFDKEVLIQLKSFNDKSQFAKSILKFVVKSMSSEIIDKLKMHFNILDKDKTGFIDLDQLKQAFTYCEIDICNNELQSLLKNKIDNKGKQKLNYTSFIAAALDERQLLDKQTLWDAFKHFDTSKNGFITLDDFKLTFDRSCKSKTMESILKMYKEVGLQPEDKIDFSKFCSLVKNKKSDIDLNTISQLEYA